MPAAFCRAVRTVCNLLNDTTVTDEQITTAVRLAGHASDKRITLHAFLEFDLTVRLVSVYQLIQVITDLAIGYSLFA